MGRLPHSVRAPCPFPAPNPYLYPSLCSLRAFPIAAIPLPTPAGPGSSFFFSPQWQKMKASSPFMCISVTGCAHIEIHRRSFFSATLQAKEIICFFSWYSLCLRRVLVLEQQFLRERESGGQAEDGRGSSTPVSRPIQPVTVSGLLLVPHRAARKGKGSGYDIMRSFWKQGNCCRWLKK